MRKNRILTEKVHKVNSRDNFGTVSQTMVPIVCLNFIRRKLIIAASFYLLKISQIMLT